MVVAFLFPSPLEVTWVINRNSMIIIDKINVFPSPLEVTWVINNSIFYIYIYDNVSVPSRGNMGY